MNFNFNLQAFEPNVRGTRKLLDLAFASPNSPRFLFSSSITADGFGNLSQLQEDYFNPNDAMEGMGYGQSKLVAEMVRLLSISFVSLRTVATEFIEIYV